MERVFLEINTMQSMNDDGPANVIKLKGRFGVLESSIILGNFKGQVDELLNFLSLYSLNSLISVT